MHPIKTCLLALVFASVLALGAPAMDADAQPAAKNPVVAPPVPMLWKVSDDDNALYLLGSFHLLKPSDYPLSPDVQLALDDAEEVVFELSPEELASPALGLQMAQIAARIDGTTLDSQIGPELAGKLSQWTRDNAAHLGKLGLTPEVLQKFKPWFVGLMVSVVELTKQGLDPDLGLDRHLMAQAVETGKATAALESGVDQIAVFAGMSEHEQLQMLAEALDQAAAGPAQIDQMHQQWRTGDVEGLWNGMALQLMRDYPQLYQRINVERNDAWVPQLVERLEAGNDDSLVVVGALHLLGEDGVVEKLRAKGYSVERICEGCENSKSVVVHRRSERDLASGRNLTSSRGSTPDPGSVCSTPTRGVKEVVTAVVKCDLTFEVGILARGKGHALVGVAITNTSSKSTWIDTNLFSVLQGGRTAQVLARNEAVAAMSGSVTRRNVGAKIASAIDAIGTGMSAGRRHESGVFYGSVNGRPLFQGQYYAISRDADTYRREMAAVLDRSEAMDRDLDLQRSAIAEMERQYLMPDILRPNEAIEAVVLVELPDAASGITVRIERSGQSVLLSL